MPKVEIFHSAGHPLSEEMKEKLSKYFEKSNIEKLERFGGRILISITAPYISRGQKRKKIKIDNKFITKLKKIRGSTSKLQKSLDELTIKELKKLARMLTIPIRSNATRSEIKSDLIGSLQAEDFWHGISGTKIPKH